MHKLKIIVSFFLLITTLISNAQTTQTGKKKKTVKIIKAHRGTVVLNIHEKVSKLAQTRYAALPKLGAVTATLPAGSVMITTGTDTFYYKNGFYYSQNPKGFQIVLPSAGVRIHGLPIGYRRVPLGGKTYFNYYGIFYAQVGSSDNYDVIIAPEGAVVDALPDGYKIQKVDNVEYYLLGDVYYAEIDASAMENKIGYEVVTIIQAYEIF
ncbi:MAG: Conserved hypothetical rane protein [Chitinophagaceae bacterium]|nr:Conserved hypothetical rane protein [Chitinophagaceae bacterium]